MHKELNPFWDETFVIPIEDPFIPINIKVILFIFNKNFLINLKIATCYNINILAYKIFIIERFVDLSINFIYCTMRYRSVLDYGLVGIHFNVITI